MAQSSHNPVEHRVGTVGFGYPDWAGVFYPRGTKSADYLSAYATAFNTLELDTTFHAVPPIERIQKWAASVPDRFLFCPKTPRTITHDIALHSSALDGFLTILDPLRETGKLGPVLLQFPPTFTRERVRELQRLLSAIPPTVRCAVEFRHRSWLAESTEQLLRNHAVAWVAADTVDEKEDPWPIIQTADFLYLRFRGAHGGYEKYDHERWDPTPRLEWWKEQALALTGVKQLFAFFADDYAGHAPASANHWRKLCGMPATKVAAKEEPQQKLFEVCATKLGLV